MDIGTGIAIGISSLGTMVSCAAVINKWIESKKENNNEDIIKIIKEEIKENFRNLKDDIKEMKIELKEEIDEEINDMRKGV